MRILDIGCGRKKIKGAIGLDFSSMSDADIIIDLNAERFPFEDNSFDFLYSSHTLEHLTMDGFWNVMREAYRILKNGGQFMIVVPYYHTSANLANPFHNNQLCFNEHTFRFLSSDYTTDSMPASHYATPSCPQWGLRYSANFELDLEFRTLAVTYYYYPEIKKLSEDEQFKARNTIPNAVDQICYSLSAVKPCPRRPEAGPVASGEDPSIYVVRQIAYLNEQIACATANHFDEQVTEKARSLLKGLSPHEDNMYVMSGVFIPVNQLVYVLDELIQSLQSQIDCFVAEEHKSAEDSP
ncbi:MAG: class I SAM-dependent methyltransferase [Pirellula sp.]|jgi:hypothetical protein|nr:class I SAM-dependent methyltransferase [Pirellula sp.]